MNPCKENQVSGDALGPFHWAVTHGIRRVCSLDQLIARFEFRQNAEFFFNGNEFLLFYRIACERVIWRTSTPNITKNLLKYLRIIRKRYIIVVSNI